MREWSLKEIKKLARAWKSFNKPNQQLTNLKRKRVILARILGDLTEWK